MTTATTLTGRIITALAVIAILGVMTDPAGAVIAAQRHSSEFVSSVAQFEGDAVPPAIFGSSAGWSAAGGILTVVNPAGADAAFGIAEDGFVLPSGAYTIEARVKVIASPTKVAIMNTQTGTAGGLGVFFGVEWTADRIQNFADPGGQFFLTDTTDGFHTVRYAVEGTSDTDAHLYYDGVEIRDDWTGLSSFNLERVVFGDDTAGANDGGIIEVDFLRFDTSGAFAPGPPPPGPVPEPATIGLLGVSGLMMLGRRRR